MTIKLPMLALLTLLSLVSLSVNIASAQPGRDQTRDAHVLHEPVNQSRGDRVVLRFDVKHPEKLGRLLVYVRGADAKQDKAIEARYDGESYVVTLGENDITRPYFQYWVAREVNGQRLTVFASQADPHFVSVPISSLQEYEKDTLIRTDGRRSTLRLDAEYVGLSTSGGTEGSHYWRAEAGYRYAFLTWVDSIDFRVSLLRSNLPSSEPVEDEETPPDIGFDFAGAAAQFRLHEYLRLRTGVIFGISEAGFEYGGLGEVVLGEPHRTSLSVGFEGVRTRGITSRAKLAWNTVPRLPMAASIEVTNFPTAEAMGVRLQYDIGYRFSSAFALRLSLGYRGQHAQQGGLVAGLGFDLSL